MALVPYASERLATLTSSTALSAATYNVAEAANREWDRMVRPEMAQVTVETADVRFTTDGTTPTTTATTSIGHLARVDDVIELRGYEEISKFRAINAVASSGSALYVTYFRAS